MNTIEPEALRELQRDQTRLRIGLAAILISVTCLFALLVSWLGQDTPLRPLLSVRVSLYALLTVYGVSVAAAAIYARWISTRRDPALAGKKLPGVRTE
jgi:hypothetical protein